MSSDIDLLASSRHYIPTALELDRRFMLVDNNPEAIQVMKDRFHDYNVEFITSSELTVNTSKTA